MGCVPGKGRGGGGGGSASASPPLRQRSDRHVSSGRRSQSIQTEAPYAAAAEVTAESASREKDEEEKPLPQTARRRRPRNIPGQAHGEQVAAGWPAWLLAVAGEAISGWTSCRADSFEKLDKVW